MFDRALRAATVGEANREATKAALVRLLWPMRQALAELGRRSGLPHDDFFLLLLSELPDALDDPAAFAEVITERRARRDYLQARIPPFWFEGAVPDPRTWARRADELKPDRTPRTLTGLGVCSGAGHRSGPGRHGSGRSPATSNRTRSWWRPSPIRPGRRSSSPWPASWSTWARR